MLSVVFPMKWPFSMHSRQSGLSWPSFKPNGEQLSCWGGGWNSHKVQRSATWFFKTRAQVRRPTQYKCPWECRSEKKSMQDPHITFCSELICTNTILVRADRKPLSTFSHMYSLKHDCTWLVHVQYMYDTWCIHVTYMLHTRCMFHVHILYMF